MLFFNQNTEGKDAILCTIIKKIEMSNTDIIRYSIINVVLWLFEEIQLWQMWCCVKYKLNFFV
jgi:hypothetical protein